MKSYGYQGSAGTCHWCGDKLRHEIAWDTREPMWDQPSYRGNGAFCSLRCGFQWAARTLEVGAAPAFVNGGRGQ